VTFERTVGIGDAENDEPFLRRCGLSVAVANAIPALKDRVDLVTTAAYGAGVAELVDGLLANQREAASPSFSLSAKPTRE
jgi:hydroxymethylpyrimidine pyrophosphatase-like HAD family hydrolase